MGWVGWRQGQVQHGMGGEGKQGSCSAQHKLWELYY
jgi:hypothetical protein